MAAVRRTRSVEELGVNLAGIFRSHCLTMRKRGATRVVMALGDAHFEAEFGPAEPPEKHPAVGFGFDMPVEDEDEDGADPTE
jgi:hypothetical protein